MISLELDMIQTAGIGAVALLVGMVLTRKVGFLQRFCIWMVCWLVSAAVMAQESEPIIEVMADRTMIYPQRMELTGEESLADVLQMMPELLIGGFENMIEGYNLRIDNAPINGDVRLILTQMKAKDIAKIQVCTNTGVAKGTIGRGNVLDINMAVPDTVKGIVEGQGGFGKDLEGNGTVNVLYGSRRTELYANASYRYQNGHKEYVSLHMTNRFDARKKLLTYLTQQYFVLPEGHQQKIMGRARYFHTFNEAGTELMILGNYQYATDPMTVNQLPIWVLELNTPLTKGLTLMAGLEGDYQLTKQKGTDRSWKIFNHDIYLEFTYSLPQWRFTLGNRVMLYNYYLTDTLSTRTRFDVRNNTDASIIFLPNPHHQIQVAYFRKYYNPAIEWENPKGLMQERDINQIKVAYAYSRQKVTIQSEGSFYIVEGEENFGEIGASAYWKTKWLTLTGGANVHIGKSKVFASVRCAPIAYLPRQWQIGLQVIYFTPQSPLRELYGTPAYGSLKVSKQIKNFLHLSVEWHDMFDSFCREAKMNRHAANITIQYRF